MLWQRANRLTLTGEPIAGFRLEPPTIGHGLLLSDLGIDIYGIEDFPDLLMACFVFAHPDHEDAERDLRAWWCPLFLRLWGGWHGRKGDPSKTADAFREFVKANTSDVEVVQDPKKPARHMGSPWIWRLYAALVGECGMTRAEAMATPILEAQLLTTALGEMRGGVELWSDKDEAFWQYCEEQDRIKANGSNQHSGAAGD